MHWQVSSTGRYQFLVEVNNVLNQIGETRRDAVACPELSMRNALAHLGELPLRTLSLVGAEDEIIPHAVAEKAIARLPTSVALRRYEGGHHLLLSDLSARQVWADVLAFLAEDLKGAKSTVECSQKHQR
ncbi:MAG: lysophospholipase [Hyphomonadaceae bacterium]|nr:lysophospholipase [Hyphomonadaceae bacterium]